jgi:multisubunit Na+/H+ antiporter MnhB subunit
VEQLQTSMRIIGSSIAAVMFLYGGAKYVYTSDDPGGRKQAIGICIAAIIAMIIITQAENFIPEANN